MSSRRDEFAEIDRLMDAGDFAGALEALKVAGIRDGIYPSKRDRQDIVYPPTSTPPTREEVLAIARLILGPDAAGE